jgi:hypothetical protein
LHENLLALRRHSGQKQDAGPAPLNHILIYKLRLSPYGDFANNIPALEIEDASKLGQKSSLIKEI